MTQTPYLQPKDVEVLYVYICVVSVFMRTHRVDSYIRRFNVRGDYLPIISKSCVGPEGDGVGVKSNLSVV